MIYCINPECNERQNSDEAEICSNCGTPLLINNDKCSIDLSINRHVYRIIKHLNSNRYNWTEVFEVEELDPTDGKKYKILKAIHDRDDPSINDSQKSFPLLTKLFRREQKFLFFENNSGIPKGYDMFSFPLSSGKELHCLVMEKIEGLNLEKWVKYNGPITQTYALEWLEQIVKIIDFVHGKQFFHRDIKPSNIMWRQSDQNLVLIDFGAVRDISETVISQSEQTTRISSYGYVAPEQANGNAKPQSDFYSLGKTFVFLLTGEQPNCLNDSSSWHQEIPNNNPVCQSLINLINSLMEEEYEKRPRNTQMILQEINRIKKEIKNGYQRKRSLLITTVAAIASGFLGIGLLSSLFNQPKNLLANEDTTTANNDPSITKILETCNSFKQGDGVTCGEETLTRYNPRLNNADKRQGFEAIQNLKFGEAEDFFQEHWNQSRSLTPDPETLIFKNNARILEKLANREISPEDVKPIAVVAPLKYQGSKDSDNYGQALEMLRGVAQAQDKAIKEGQSLFVVIANDGNRKDKAKESAEKLAKNKHILGVIGHYASSIVKAAHLIYKESRLPIVSPSSTSTELSQSKYTYLYRIAPNDNASAQKIAKYLNNKTTPQTIAIFWSKGKTFSDSLRDASIKELGGTIINNNIVDEEIFDLSTQNFNADRVLNEIKRQGVTAIILIPDSSGDDSPAIRNAHELIQKNQEPNLIIIGGDTLYTNNTRQVVQESVAKDNFFTAVAWHPLANPQFTQNAQRWWGTRNISWLTGTSYDATLVLNQATRNSNNREGVNQILSDEQFILREGATGSIKFEGSDRAEQESTLVKTLNFCDNRLNYVFVPEDYPGSCVSPDR